MGVDYYVCNCCEDTFPDVGRFVSCNCGYRWCSADCAEEEGYRQEEDGFIPEGSKWTQDTSCNYCRKENHDDSALLHFALKLLGKTRENLILEFNKSK